MASVYTRDRRTAVRHTSSLMNSARACWPSSRSRAQREPRHITSHATAGTASLPSRGGLGRTRRPEAGEPPVILGVGRLTHQKDFHTLLEAFAIVRGQRKCRLMILGEGEDRDSLEALARKLGVAADVRLIGFATNPYKYMARSSVFVLSSRYEGLPNVLIEAMGLATPVVSTDCPGGAREILLDGKLGPLVPVGDSQALANELGSILGDLESSRRRVGHVQANLDRFRPEACLMKYVELAQVGD